MSNGTSETPGRSPPPNPACLGGRYGPGGARRATTSPPQPHPPQTPGTATPQRPTAPESQSSPGEHLARPRNRGTDTGPTTRGLPALPTPPDGTPRQQPSSPRHRTTGPLVLRLDDLHPLPRQRHGTPGRGSHTGSSSASGRHRPGRPAAPRHHPARHPPPAPPRRQRPPHPRRRVHPTPPGRRPLHPPPRRRTPLHGRLPAPTPGRGPEERPPRRDARTRTGHGQLPQPQRNPVAVLHRRQHRPRRRRLPTTTRTHTGRPPQDTGRTATTHHQRETPVRTPAHHPASDASPPTRTPPDPPTPSPAPTR